MKGLTGRTKLSRLRQQVIIGKGLPNLFDDEQQRWIGTQAEELEELRKLLFPKWLDPRAVLSVESIDPKRRLWEIENTGKSPTHIAKILPTLTALDTWQMLYGMQMGLMSVAAAGYESATGKSLGLPGDLEADFFEPFLSTLYGPLEVGARMTIGNLGADLDYVQKGMTRYLRPDEALLLRGIPSALGGDLLRGAIHEDPETGRYMINTALYTAYKTVPILSTQLPYIYRATKVNPEWENGMGEGLSWMMRNLLRLGYEVPYDARREAQALGRSVQEQYGKRPLRKEAKIRGAAQRAFQEERIKKLTGE
jgi:hypothetical protein